MTSKNQINHWTQQQQQSADDQKQLANKLKIEGANMLKDIYDAIQHIKEYITQLEKAHEDTHNNKKQETIILREDCRALNYLCECLERVLLFGFKKKFFRSSSLWCFITDSTAKCLSISQQLATDINLIKSIQDLNEIGKTRAFLRQSLRSKTVPLYFELILNQRDVIEDYYWDFGVMSQENQGRALLAQLEELNYLPQHIEFEMLLSDKALNIMEYFKVNEHGVPQWNIAQDKGDINMMIDVWLLKNREIVEEKKMKKHRKKKKHKQTKRKLNTLASTDDLRIRSDEDEDEMMINIEKASKKKKKKKQGEKGSKSKRKKKKRDREKKKKKKKKESQSLLSKQLDKNTQVIDDSEYIQNILQKQPQSPGIYLRNSPKITAQNVEEINIDDLIDEHLENEQKQKEIESLLETPSSAKEHKINRRNYASLSTPNSLPTTPKYAAQSRRAWFQFNRSSSWDANAEENKVKSSSFRRKPNDFIKGISSAQRPFEIVVIGHKNSAKYSSSTPPPPRRRNIHKIHENRRYLSGRNVSQSTSPPATKSREYGQKDKEIESNGDCIPYREKVIESIDSDWINPHSKQKSDYSKPILSAEAKQFILACSKVVIDEEKEAQISKKVERVQEIRQKREHDEYETDEDNEKTQMKCTTYTDFNEFLLQKTAAAQGEVDDEEGLRLQRVKEKDETLRRYAAAVDFKNKQLAKRQKESQSHSQFDLMDAANENDSNSAEKLETTQSNDGDAVFFIPKEQKDRFSQFMTKQYRRRKRLESQDFSALLDDEFESISDGEDINDVIAANASSAAADIAHNELQRDTIKQSQRGWHCGVEISWRTTPLPPRDNNKILMEQNFRCATCGVVLQSNFLRRAKYHYCRYLGLIHCNECHKNERAVIPHRVLHDLDCKPSTVCCAAKKYLDEMYHIPCITLNQFSAHEKVRRNKKIEQLHKIMFELQHIKNYLDVCRDGNELIASIYCEYQRWLKHVGRLSLRDCVNILSFNTGDKLQILSNKLQKHIVSECDMCRGKGWNCEICTNSTPIYSFQYKQVEQCKVCNACFHSNCWKKVNQNCPRCKRRQKLSKITQIK